MCSFFCVSMNLFLNDGIKMLNSLTRSALDNNQQTNKIYISTTKQTIWSTLMLLISNVDVKFEQEFILSILSAYMELFYLFTR